MVMFRFAESSGAAASADTPPAPGDPPVDRVDREEAGGVWSALLPWGISILIHGGLVVLALFTIWIAVTRSARERVVPTIETGVARPRPMRMTDPPVRTEPTSPAREPMRTPPAPTPAGPAAPPAERELALLSVEAPGAADDPFAPPVVSRENQRVEVFGSKGHARRIVFIIDATGSLVDVFPFVIDELKQTIADLNPEQRFTVVLYNGQGVTRMPPPDGLRPADAKTTTRALDWLSGLSGIVRGSANPVEAIHRALVHKPELIFLLSDNITGAGQSALEPAELLKEIKRTNTSGTRINTMQFIYRDPRTVDGARGTMQRIAEQTGGRYSYISAEELSK